MVENLGKGALRDLPDARDYKASSIMRAPRVDWVTGLLLPEPPSNDQGTSSSCVGQAWSYYHWQLRNKDFCRRDIYAWIYQQGGGAYVRDGGIRLINFGQELRSDAQDPVPETEAGMIDRTGLDPNKSKVYQELNSFVVSNDIDSIAAAIKNYNGVVFGVNGSNPGWQDLANPRPPLVGETLWGHCLYLFGYHLYDGQKCVVAKSSWGNSGNTTVHHIKENYFTSGNTFNAWTLIPKGQQMSNQAKVVKSKKTPTVYICYPVPDMDYLTKTSNLQGITVPEQIPDSDNL